MLQLVLIMQATWAQRADSSLVKKLLADYRITRIENPAEAERILDKADSVALLLHDLRWTAEIDFYKCRRLEQADKQKCIACNEKVAAVFERINFKPGLKDCYAKLGHLYGVTGYNNRSDDLAKSLVYLKKTLDLLKVLPDKKLESVVLNNFGHVYLMINDKQALYYMKRALEVQSEFADSARLSSSLAVLGLTYSMFGDRVAGLNYVKLALQNEKRFKHYKRDEIMFSGNLGSMYLQLTEKDLAELQLSNAERLTMAQQHITHSLQMLLDDPTSSKIIIATTRVLLARYYNQRGQFIPALQELRLAKPLLEQMNDQVMIFDLYEELGVTYNGVKQYDSAYYYIRKLPALKDSMRTGELSVLVTQAEVAYEYKKLEERLQQNQGLAEAKLRQQELISEKRRRELLHKEILLKTAEKAIQINRLSYLRAITDLKHAELIRRERENELLLQQQGQALRKSKVSLQQSMLSIQRQDLQERRKQKLLLIATLMLVVTVLAVVYRLYKSRQKSRTQLENEKEKAMHAEIAKRMAEFEMEGLRAQLNPHFMFNSLNAIQEQILKDENERAADYLTIFARMLRQLLENSEKPFISLHNELQFIGHYLFMEKLRMPELNYEINLGSCISPRNVMIPNMIIQPYLENAIWHGLSAKKGSRRLSLNVEEVNESIIITIEDNGIGRQAAEELKSRYRKTHKSVGMELLKKRFNLMQVEYGSGLGVDIKDLNTDGYASGTQVVLTIPVMYTGKLEALMRETTVNN